MAAYIGLNAVRGGLVEDPKDYWWCGYAEAVSGSRRAQRGLNRAMGRARQRVESAEPGGSTSERCCVGEDGAAATPEQGMSAWERTEMEGWERSGAAESYRCLLYASGVEVKDAQQVNVVRRGVTAERAREVLAVKGKLSAAELIRLRVRYFADGVALGSREFVKGVFAQHRDFFSPKRKDGARPLPESEDAIFTLRRLRSRAVG